MNLRQRLARLESKATRTAHATHGHTCGPIILIDVGQKCPSILPCQRCDREGRIRFIEFSATEHPASQDTPAVTRSV